MNKEGEIQYQNNNYNKALKANANKLRAHMTKAESCLWKYCLRAGMMDGHKFRRQRPVGWYIADFVSLDLMLVIEVDGATHLFEETQKKDAVKEKFFMEQGYKLIRFNDEEVLNNIDMVAEKIRYAIKEQEEKLEKDSARCPPLKGVSGRTKEYKE